MPGGVVIWLLVIVIVVLLCVVGVLAFRQRRSAQLREGFGPEYERVVRARGDQGAAEAELRERRDRRRGYDIRPLDPAARERYSERWRATQAQFVDQPASSLGDADALVAEVMSERGYPVEDFEQQAADVSVDHPGVVEHYRQAHAIYESNSEQRASTEDLRQAMVHYRALFAELLEPTDRDDQSTRSNRIEEVK
jgi:hypothetical protein